MHQATISSHRKLYQNAFFLIYYRDPRHINRHSVIRSGATVIDPKSEKAQEVSRKQSAHSSSHIETNPAFSGSLRIR